MSEPDWPNIIFEMFNWYLIATSSNITVAFDGTRFNFEIYNLQFIFHWNSFKSSIGYLTLTGQFFLLQIYNSNDAIASAEHWTRFRVMKVIMYCTMFKCCNSPCLTLIERGFLLKCAMHFVFWLAQQLNIGLLISPKVSKERIEISLICNSNTPQIFQM